MIALWTMANLAASLLLSLFMLFECRHSRVLGWKKVSFQVSKARLRRGLRRNLYGVTISFEGRPYFMVVTEEEYENLRTNRTGETYVFAREFASRLLSPNLEKAEFSLKETSWKDRDGKKCAAVFLLMFLSLEFIILVVAMGA